MNNSIKTILERELESALVSIVAIGQTKDPIEIQKEAMESVLNTFQARTYSQAYEEGRRSTLEQMRGHSGEARRIVNDSEMKMAQARASLQTKELND